MNAVEFNCQNCRFWVAAADQPRHRETLKDGEGECRRRAPVGGGFSAFFAPDKKATRMIAVMYPWPVSHKDDWCGEFINLHEPS